MSTKQSVSELLMEDVVTEGLNSVYEQLMKFSKEPLLLDEEDFIEHVTKAAREYAKICVESSHEENETL